MGFAEGEDWRGGKERGVMVSVGGLGGAGGEGKVKGEVG